MRRCGTLLIEVLISMLVFLIGVLVLASVMILSLNVVTHSKEAVKADRDLVNKVENYMISRTVSHVETPSGASVKHILSNKTVNIDGFTLKYSVYRYMISDKLGSSYYILQREK